ncbi:MAG: hypothetical protein LBH77_04555, partial [Tannerella sp.]|nr:hypothetical protein [Tannerella sp.]
ALSLHRVFHGIRFKVNNEDCGCRETTILFLYKSLIDNPIQIEKTRNRRLGGWKREKNAS